MPKQDVAEFKAGLFVSLGLALMMVVIFMLGSEQEFFTRQYRLYTNFSDISGLRTGAIVQLAGLKVGFVDDIHFPKDPSTKQITVALQVKKRFQDRIRKDSVATIETQGLLGDKFIHISVGSEGQPEVPDKGIVESKQTTSIFSLADKAGAIMEDMGEAAESLKDLMTSLRGGEGGKNFEGMVSSLKKTLEQVEKGSGLAHALIYDPKGKEVVGDLADTMRSVKDVVQGAKVETKGQMGGMIANLRTASGDLKDILGAVKRGEGTLGRLVNDPTLYDDLLALFGKASRNNVMKSVIKRTIEENEGGAPPKK